MACTLDAPETLALKLAVTPPLSFFFRILQPAPDEKGAALREAIAAVNRGESHPLAFPVSPADFNAIPGSPFAYWVSENTRQLFRKLPKFEEDEERYVRVGASTKNDFRFLRLHWEVDPNRVGRKKRWAMFAKGGSYSPFYSDVYLLILWENEALELTEYIVGKYSYLDTASWVLHTENDYRKPGITFPRRPHKKGSFRALPRNCIFADNGPAIFSQPSELLPLLAFTNSEIFNYLTQLQMGRGTTRSGQTMTYEIGVIQQIPIPSSSLKAHKQLTSLAQSAYNLARLTDLTDEITHPFQLPALLHGTVEPTLTARLQAFARAERERLDRLAAIQAEIDRTVADLYGVPELLDEIEDGGRETEEAAGVKNNTDVWNGLEVTPQRLVADLLMWCVGAAFGRWDARFALDPTLLPELQGPFDPLPVCAPGSLVGPDGLPATPNRIVSEAWLRARPNVITLPDEIENRKSTIDDRDYPLPIPWNGILVDDPTHPWDIVAAVRRVLRLIWGEGADAIEDEACQILGVTSLRAWFRDPRKGFFNFHIKRYSKSRRKAPIYWLLQSSKRNYAVWLYYHRLTKDTLYLAGREYVDAKIKLESNRLEELRQQMANLSGAARKAHEKKLTAQTALVEEIKAFGKALDEAALLDLTPDLNDGVVLTIAPLREITPWREARKYWDALLEGKYTWSSISQQMLQKGYRKG